MTGAFSSASDVLVFVLVVGTRFVLPLLIPRFPLPAILGCLVLDAADQTLMATFTDLPLDNYQSYDKALDIYYQSIAFTATLRNWTNHTAYLIGAFLYIYRLVGVALFEAFPPEGARWVLLIFPNTFEYYFIALEVIAIIWAMERLSRRFLLWLMAGIWVLIKLPQEYWIHIAQLDTTDVIKANPWVGVLMLVGIVALVLVARFVVWPRTPPADHEPRLRAPTPEVSGAPGLGIRPAAFAAELAVLTLVIFIFGEILPGVGLSLLEVILWVSGLVIIDALVSAVLTRFSLARGLAKEFAVLVVLNLAFVFVLLGLTGRGPLLTGDWTSAIAALFFVLLLTLITVLIDHYQPIHDRRFHPLSAPG